MNHLAARPFGKAFARLLIALPLALVCWWLAASSASYSTTVARTLTVSVTRVATWTAHDAPLFATEHPSSKLLSSSAEQMGVKDIWKVNATAIPAGSQQSATMRISAPDQNQDDDGIPDNVEDAGDKDYLPNFRDTNADGDAATPDYLDPATGAGASLFLPQSSGEV